MRGRGQRGPGRTEQASLATFRPSPGLSASLSLSLHTSGVPTGGQGPQQPTPVSQVHPQKQVFPVEAGSGVQAGTVRYCELMAGSLQNGQCFYGGPGVWTSPGGQEADSTLGSESTLYLSPQLFPPCLSSR